MRIGLLIATLALLVGASFTLVPSSASGASVEELRAKIEEQNQQLRELEEEIARYEAELEEVGAEKSTLERAIRELDLSRQRLAADIRATERRIEATSLEITELSSEITDKERRIEQNEEAIAAAIRRMNELETQSFFEQMLVNRKFSDAWDQIATLEQFQGVVRSEIKVLANLKEDLEDTKTEEEVKRQELASFRQSLSGQKSVLDGTRSQKNELLDETKSKESNYQQILAEKKEAYESYQRQLSELESALETAINPNALPKVGQGVLRWPFQDSYFARCPSYEKALGNPHCITQYFGNTPFATKNPQVYGGRGHNGADFRAPIGTPLVAALSGVVEARGNTDLQRGCYSYGKWILIRHYNGLSTLYAHLSHFAVSEGEEVSTGDIIGYSGNTGYSTGPHLHFTVYASEGVRVVRLGDVKTFTNCSDVHIPIAPFEAYLNPLSYL